MAELEMVKREFLHALLAVNIKVAEEILLEAGADLSMVEIADNILAPSLEAIGAGWEDGTVSLAHLYMSGRMCEQLVDKILKANLPVRKDQPEMAMAVIEDYHSLGKKIVLSVLKVAGYEVLDYGQGLSTTEVIERSLEDGIKILLISAHLLPSALLVKNMTKLLKLRNPCIKVIVGGAPFVLDKNLWVEVGADAMGSNSSDAIGLVKRMAVEGSEDD